MTELSVLLLLVLVFVLCEGRRRPQSEPVSWDAIYRGPFQGGDNQQAAARTRGGGGG